MNPSFPMQDSVDRGYGSGLWLPGLRLMSRMNFAYKALLISVMFL